MAQFATPRRPSQVLPPNVNRYCGQCDSQIGIFDNEWIRLTAKYARSKDKGTNFGTEVGHETKKVPDGVAEHLRFAAGCELAEVFCNKCSLVIGQYCRAAPSTASSFLIDQYFYDLQKTYLKDAQTARPIDPEFGYNGDIGPPSFKRQRMSVAPTPRMSRPPLVSSWTPRSSLGAHVQPTSLRGSRQSSVIGYSRDESVLTMRLEELEQRVADHDMTLTEQDSSFMSNTSHSSVAQQIEAEKNENVIQEQKNQINDLTGQIGNLRSTIDDLQDLIRKLKTKNDNGKETPLHDPSFMSSFDSMVKAVKEAQANSEDMHLLREENEALRGKLNRLTQAFQLALNDPVGSGDATNQDTVQDVGVVPNKAKRKRGASKVVAPAQSSSVRKPRSRAQKQAQPPTPVSSQQSADGTHARQDGQRSNSDQSSPCAVELHQILDDFAPADDEDVLEAPGQEMVVASNGLATAAPAASLQSTQSKVPSASGIEDEVVDFSDEEGHDEPSANYPSISFVSASKATGHLSTPRFYPAPGKAGTLSPAYSFLQAPSTKVQWEAGQLSTHLSLLDQAGLPTLNQVQLSIPLTPELEQYAIVDSSQVDNMTLVTPQDIERRLAGEATPPRELRPHMQTTEKKLRAELEELGLAHWIGKSKNDNEYRQAVDNARMKLKEQNKSAALAKYGLRTGAISVATPFTTEPEQDVTSTEQHEVNEAPLAQAITRTQLSRRASTKAAATVEPDAEVLQDVDDNNQRKPKLRGRPRKKRSSGEENKPENTVRESLANIAEPKSVKKTRGRKSQAPIELDEDVDELSKSRVQQTRKPSGRKSKARGNVKLKPEPKSKTPKNRPNKKSMASVRPVHVPAEEEDAQGESDHEMVGEAVMTRAQQREAEIEKRDRMAQEVMDAMDL